MISKDSIEYIKKVEYAKGYKDGFNHAFYSLSDSADVVNSLEQEILRLEKEIEDLKNEKGV